MSVNYNAPTVTSRLNDVVQAIDSGASGAFGGTFNLYDIGNNLVSSMLIPNPCGSVAGNVLTFFTAIVDSAAIGGTAISANIKDANGNVVASGMTVGAGSTDHDVVMSPTNTILPGQTVSMTTATITGH